MSTIESMETKIVEHNKAESKTESMVIELFKEHKLPPYCFLHIVNKPTFKTTEIALFVRVESSIEMISDLEIAQIKNELRPILWHTSMWKMKKSLAKQLRIIADELYKEPEGENSGFLDQQTGTIGGVNPHHP